MSIKKKSNLPKTLDWTQIDTESGLLEFDCPKCMSKNSINTSIFKTKNHQDREELKLSDQKFGYTDKGLVFLSNIIAAGITILILFGLLGELMSHEEYRIFIYVLGIPIMVVSARIIITLFRKTLPVWLLKCMNCGEQIILSSNGIETHLARDTAADKNSDQVTATQAQEQTNVKSANEAAIWDLKNGDKKAKNNAALDLLTSKDPNAVEIILEQALKEDPETENTSFFSSSIKIELLLTLAMNLKNVRTSNSVSAYINVLSSGDEIVINHAILQLGSLGSRRAIEPLEKLNIEGFSGLKPSTIEKTINSIKKRHGIPIN